jgi:hypothetical protein
MHHVVQIYKIKILSELADTHTPCGLLLLLCEGCQAFNTIFFKEGVGIVVPIEFVLGVCVMTTWSGCWCCSRGCVRYCKAFIAYS